MIVSPKLTRRLVRGALFFTSGSVRDSAERWMRGRQELANIQRADCVIVSYSKSGRTWLRVMLWKFYQIKFDLAESGIVAFENIESPAADMPRIMFTHDTYTADVLGPNRSKAPFYERKVILLVRHPCDVAVSNYFQWRYRTKDSKLSMIGLPPRTDDLSIYDFVMTSSRGLPSIIPFMNAWGQSLSKIKQHLVVRYEDMRADPTASLKRILNFLGTPFVDEHIARAAEFASFENMKRMTEQESFHWSGARLGARDPNIVESHKVRRGKIGGYREYFDAPQSEALEAYVGARLIESFGYGATPESGRPAGR